MVTQQARTGRKASVSVQTRRAEATHSVWTWLRGVFGAPKVEFFSLAGTKKTRPRTVGANSTSSGPQHPTSQASLHTRCWTITPSFSFKEAQQLLNSIMIPRKAAGYKGKVSFQIQSPRQSRQRPMLTKVTLKKKIFLMLKDSVFLWSLNIFYLLVL